MCEIFNPPPWAPGTKQCGDPDGQTRAIWISHIEAGRVLIRRHKTHQEDVVDFEKAVPQKAISMQDTVKFAVHVHESVVVADRPKVIFEDERMVVAMKPAGVPTCDDVDGSNNVVSLLNCLEGAASLARAHQQNTQAMAYQNSGAASTRKRKERQMCKSGKKQKQQQVPNNVKQAHCTMRYRAVHRLDKPVSGLLILAKGGAGKQNLMQIFADRRIRKTYVARVQGVGTAAVFPKTTEEGARIVVDAERRENIETGKTAPAPAVPEPAAVAGSAAASVTAAASLTVSAAAATIAEVSPSAVHPSASLATSHDPTICSAEGKLDAAIFNTDCTGWFEVNVPLARENFGRNKVSVCRDANRERGEGKGKGKGKDAITYFRLLHTLQDGTSVVLCRPHTGRHHQIRAHLSW
jgi:23S rRNA-/tRNA-specific pseudouridylate synthase